MKQINIIDEVFAQIVEVMRTVPFRQEQRIWEIDVIAYVLERNRKLEAVAQAADAMFYDPDCRCSKYLAQALTDLENLYEHYDAKPLPFPTEKNEC